MRDGLRVVFCGFAVGDKSAQKGAYYAEANNKFWRILCEIGLTPIALEPLEYRRLLEYDIGLTDLVKTFHGSDRHIDCSMDDIEALVSKVKKYAPRALGFNGKKAAKRFLRTDSVEYGLQPPESAVGPTTLFVLPSTSGAANRYWNIGHWQKLADYFQK